MKPEAKLETRGLHHIAIQVADLERSLTFYRDLLGLDEVRRQAHSAWLLTGDVILMLERIPARNAAGEDVAAPSASGTPVDAQGAAVSPFFAPKGSPVARNAAGSPSPLVWPHPAEPLTAAWPSAEAGPFVLALRIDPSDRERWRERLVSRGHPVERESPYTLYVRCPDGARIGLSHYPDSVA